MNSLSPSTQETASGHSDLVDSILHFRPDAELETRLASSVELETPRRTRRRAGVGAEQPSFDERLQVGREDLSWFTTQEQVVVLRIHVRNQGPSRSRRQVLEIGAAPLGVFVDPSPVGSVEVPPIDPWGERVVEARFPRVRLPESDFTEGGLLERIGDRLSPAARRRPELEEARAGLGSPEWWGTHPPSRHSGALFGRGELRRTPAEQRAMRDRLRGLPWWKEVARRRAPALVAQFEALAELRNSSVHWAGNFHVSFRGKQAERHRAVGVRLHPGCLSAVRFQVGEQPWGQEFSFEVEGAEPLGWKAWLVGNQPHAAMANMLERRVVERLACLPEVTPVQLKTPWVLLFVDPGEGPVEGKLDVHVRDHVGGGLARVELDFLRPQPLPRLRRNKVD